MFQIDLIRHGRTKGNEERRYVGRTDKGLSRRAGWNSVKYGSTWMARSAAETIWTVKSVRAVGMIRMVKSGNAVEVTWIVKKHECSRAGRYRRSTRQNALPDVVFQSPLRRCQESADILFRVSHSL